MLRALVYSGLICSALRYLLTASLIRHCYPQTAGLTVEIVLKQPAHTSRTAYRCSFLLTRSACQAMITASSVSFSRHTHINSSIREHRPEQKYINIINLISVMWVITDSTPCEFVVISLTFISVFHFHPITKYTGRQ